MRTIKYAIKFKTILIICFYGAGFFIFSGCALTVLFPGSLNQRPDTSGATLAGDINFGMEQYFEVSVFDNFTQSPPQRAVSGSSASSLKAAFPALPIVNYNVGVIANLDAYYTDHLGLKYQFLGSRNTEGPKLSLFGGFGSSKSSASSSGCTGGTCTGETLLSGYELGLSSGYGFSKNGLVYGTLGRRTGDAKTTIVQPTQTYKYTDTFEHDIFSLGIEVGEKWYFNPEVSYAENRWKIDTATLKKSGTTWIITGGFRW